MAISAPSGSPEPVMMITSRRIVPIADRRQDIEAVSVGKTDIQKHHVERLLPGEFVSFPQRVRHPGFVAQGTDLQ